MVALSLMLLLVVLMDVVAAFISYGSMNIRVSRRSHLFSSEGSSFQEEIRYIAGRRAIILHPPDKPNDYQNSHSYPPLVILGGMAQSISSYEYHLPQLSKHRSVLMYEPIGIGPAPPYSELQGNTSLEKYYYDVSLERHGNDFWEVVDEAFFSDKDDDDDNTKIVDVASFSFGGRVALSAAANQPHRLRRLHISGVGHGRDTLASVHITSWKEILGDKTKVKNDDDNSRLQAFAWSIILATYSSQFLESMGPDRIKMWVDSVCENNTEEGLRAILMQTQDADEWSPAAMANRIQAADKSIDSCRIVVGAQDKIASPMQALQLAKIFCDDTDDIYKVIEGCGHAIPMEAMRLWREDVLQYLNK